MQRDGVDEARRGAAAGLDAGLLLLDADAIHHKRFITTPGSVGRCVADRKSDCYITSLLIERGGGAASTCCHRASWYSPSHLHRNSSSSSSSSSSLERVVRRLLRAVLARQDNCLRWSNTDSSILE